MYTFVGPYDAIGWGEHYVINKKRFINKIDAINYMNSIDDWDIINNNTYCIEIIKNFVESNSFERFTSFNKDECIDYINDDTPNKIFCFRNGDDIIMRNTILHDACRYPNVSIETILSLIKRGWTNDIKDEDNKSPLELLSPEKYQKIYEYTTNKLRHIIALQIIKKFLLKKVVLCPNSKYIRRLVGEF
jgi:hypothetical protein